MKQANTDHGFVDQSVVYAGEELLLTSERAIVWPAMSMVLVADVHLGKESVFGRHGIAVPDGATQGDLDRLSALVARYRCKQVMVLGDFVHARPRAGDRWPQRIGEWLDAHPEMVCHIVAGNHDGKRPQTMLDQRLRWHTEPLDMGPFVLCHEPQIHSDGVVLCGHLHPTQRLKANGFSLRAPVYWLGERCGVLPSFGRFTGGHDVQPQAGDQVWAVTPGSLHDLSAVAGSRSQ